MSSPPTLQNGHFRKLAHLLTLESKAEAEKLKQELENISPAAAEASGGSLIHLAIRQEESGLGGRLLLTLGKRNPQNPLPWTRLRVGTPVQLHSEGSDAPPGWRGVVSRLQRKSIEIALDRWPDDFGEGESYRLDLAPDEVARRRMLDALAEVDSAAGNRLAQLREILLGERLPMFTQTASARPLNPTLNNSQWRAVQNALAAEDVALIHGPPGTGKTTAVVELIRLAVARGERILACAPSNLAVDNIFERLLAAPEFSTGLDVIRIGHPARVLPGLRDQTLEMLVESHSDMKVIRKLTKQAIGLRNQASKYTRAKPAPGERNRTRAEAKSMLRDARHMEVQLVERVLDGARVICATTTGLDERLLADRGFDLCIIDEAGQSLEPGCWIPLLRCKRVVLAGDHFQLPPTVVSAEAAAHGLGVSLLERLMRRRGEDEGREKIAQQLTVQYRMHEAIMQFSSSEFYRDTLEAFEGVQNHRLCGLPGVVECVLTTTPVHFIDTAGADYSEELEPDGESRLNPQEAMLVRHKVEQLVTFGVCPSDIAVISPYAAQVRYLRAVLHAEGKENPEVGTIDAFQGREKEAIIISLVRSNSEREIGFLEDTRRMNVALTRARRSLIIIGDSATIGGHPFYRRLLDYVEKIDSYHTVWEEVEA